MTIVVLALLGTLAPSFIGGAAQHAIEALKKPQLQPTVLDDAALNDRLRLARPAHLLDRGALERATARGNEVEVRLPIRELPVGKFEYGELSAAGWTDASSRVAASGDEAVLNLARDVGFVVRPKAPEELRLGADPTFSSGTVLYPTEQRSPDGSPEVVVRQWSLFVCTRHDPVIWNESANAYATSLVVGVEDAERSGRSELLPEPITVQFFLSGRGLEIDPVRLEVTKSGTAGFVEAALRCRSHQVDDASIRARGSLGEQRWSFAVQPSLGSLRVELSPRTILGFGLESAAVVVRRCAEDGTEWSSADPLPVTLVADRGTLPAALVIPAGGSSATAELRSSSVGLVTVTASAEGRSSDPAPILFAWPLALLGVALAFGGLGGLFRAWQEERKRTRRSANRLAVRAAAGAFTSLVFVPAAVLGLAQAGVDAAVARSEAGAAVLAALAGWTGTLALTALARRLGIDPGDAQAPAATK